MSENENLHRLDFGNPGMSPRQWYAGVAMNGFLSNPSIPSTVLKEKRSDETEIEALVGACFVVADLMLKEEEEQNSGTQEG